MPRSLGSPGRPSRWGKAGVRARVHTPIDQHAHARDPGRRDRCGLRDCREQGDQAHAPSNGGWPLAVCRQNSERLAEDAAVPLAEGTVGEPGEGRERRAGGFPLAVRDGSHVHRRVQEERPGCGREVPGPDRDPWPGAPDRGAAACFQAQGSARSDHLHHLPGPSGFLGRPPPGGPGAQGGPDHRGAAGRGSTQGAMALQPGHGSLGGPPL